MKELVAFLLARITEDEDAARRAQLTSEGEPNALPPDWSHLTGVRPHIARWNPRRVFAECSAKRTRVEAVSALLDAGEAYQLLLLEVQPYYGHPDFQLSWVIVGQGSAADRLPRGQYGPTAAYDAG